MKPLIPPLFWCLIYLLIIPSWLFGQVICFGVDGHIALEIAHTGECQNSSTPDVSLSNLKHGTHHCFDIIVLSINPENSYLFSPISKVKSIVIESLPQATLTPPRISTINISSTLVWKPPPLSLLPLRL